MVPKILDMEVRVHGEGVDHPYVASSFHQMGVIVQLRGRLDDVERRYRRKLRYVLTNDGEDANRFSSNPPFVKSLGASS